MLENKGFTVDNTGIHILYACVSINKSAHCGICRKFN
jgi:hypothetical protein